MIDVKPTSLIFSIFPKFILSLLFLSGSYSAHSQVYPKHEVRAVWLTTIGGLDWPHSYARSSAGIARQKQELCSILDRLQHAGINTILFQTRIRGTVIYPSSMEPWDGCTSGVPGMSPGYDPLAFAIEQCHHRGMEIQAWIVCIPLGKWNGYGCKTLRKKQPSLVTKVGDEGFLNPESTQTPTYLAQLAGEITEKYDIDGIHLDYIRYPETWPKVKNAERARHNITAVVSAIYNKVKNIKPWVKISSAPIGKFNDLSRYSSRGWNAYARVYQDVENWLQQGIMDQIYPMMYFSHNQFFPFAIHWKEISNGHTVVPGLGTYMLSPKERNWPLETLTNQLQVLRRERLGYAHFRSRFFTDNVKGIYTYTTEQFNHFPALIPSVSPQKVNVPIPRNGYQSARKLSWNSSLSNNGKSTLRYNLYASKKYPVDISKASNLILPYLTDTMLVLPSTLPQRYYAVTAIDRYGNESEALQLTDSPKYTDIPQTFLSCSEDQIQLPDVLPNTLYLITTLQGIVIQSATAINGHISVSTLPPGMYILRTLTAKGYSHRIGYFQKMPKP